MTLQDFSTSEGGFAILEAEGELHELSEWGIASWLINRHKATPGHQPPFPDARIYASTPSGQWLEYDLANGWRSQEHLLEDVAEYTDRLCTIDAMARKGDGDCQPELDKLRSKWRRRAVFENAIALAKPAMTRTGWDALPNVLGTVDGMTVELETDWIGPALQEDRITLRTGFEPATPTREWLAWVDDVCGGDGEMSDGLQAWLGASLYAGNPQGKIHILYGDSHTGKSTLLAVVKAALGDYAGSADPSTFTKARMFQHPAAMLPFEHKRLVALPELAGDTFRSDLVKSITGGDTLSLRGMRENPRDVEPMATLWFSSNDLPSPGMVDAALKAQIMVWPFDVVHRHDEQVRDTFFPI